MAVQLVLRYDFMFLHILQHNKSIIVDYCVGEKYIDISILQGEGILLSCNAQNRLKFNNCRPGGIMLFTCDKV